ncbi:MAG: TonB-dependent receptor [Prevotella sp.]|nr:TonB-dependent receptor [Prevotella sp.]
MQSAHSHENEVAGYVDFRQDITEWLTIDAGLRYDHHSTAGGEWVPQAGIVLRPVETGALKVGPELRNQSRLSHAPCHLHGWCEYLILTQMGNQIHQKKTPAES